MAAKTPVYRRLIAGVGGASLILAVFLPWAGVEGVNRTGWEFNTVAAVLSLPFVRVAVRETKGRTLEDMSDAG